MPQTAARVRSHCGPGRLPVNLIPLFLPGVLFGIGLFLLRDQPRYAWLASPAKYPWEFWLILACGLVATAAGVLDWRFHRSGKTVVGRAEHHSEFTAMAAGGLPLFVLMMAASIVPRPQLVLIPVLVAALFTSALICYDEFVFHRKRCDNYENLLHRLLVFGNGIAWLAWVHWCFVREASHG
jgi:hypothetical protein